MSRFVRNMHTNESSRTQIRTLPLDRQATIDLIRDRDVAAMSPALEDQ